MRFRQHSQWQPRPVVLGSEPQYMTIFDQARQRTLNRERAVNFFRDGFGLLAGQDCVLGRSVHMRLILNLPCAWLGPLKRASVSGGAPRERKVIPQE